MTHGSFPIYSYIINLDLKELINLEAFPIFVLLMFSFVCSLKIAIIYIMKALFLFYLFAEIFSPFLDEKNIYYNFIET